jgi:hypothetical protein
MFGGSFWSRCLPGVGPGCQARFKESVQLFFQSVEIQARARANGVVLDLETYVDVRRDNSGKCVWPSLPFAPSTPLLFPGCKPCWALIE